MQLIGLLIGKICIILSVHFYFDGVYIFQEIFLEKLGSGNGPSKNYRVSSFNNVT